MQSFASNFYLLILSIFFLKITSKQDWIWSEKVKKTTIFLENRYLLTPVWDSRSVKEKQPFLRISVVTHDFVHMQTWVSPSPSHHCCHTPVSHWFRVVIILIVVQDRSSRPVNGGYDATLFWQMTIIFHTLHTVKGTHYSPKVIN